MSKQLGVMLAKGEDDQKWLFSQFQAACASLRERSSYRRGPFWLDDTDLPVVTVCTKNEAGLKAKAIQE
jgi:hypothetical protein